MLYFLTNGFKSLDVTSSSEVVPSEQDKHRDDNQGWNDEPLVRCCSRGNDSQAPQQQLNSIFKVRTYTTNRDKEKETHQEKFTKTIWKEVV